MNEESNFYELSAVVHRAITERWSAHRLGNEILAHFYGQVPLFGGERAFWRDILEGCLENVRWTALARRALREAAAA